jgi:hypothetical protein
MSQIYVANGTLQNRDFNYRIKGVDTPRMVKIRAGGQAVLPDNLDGLELQDVIEQLTRAGAVPQSETSNIVLTKALIFDVRKNPIDPDRIQEALEKDEAARQETAAQKMEEAGLAAFNNADAQNPGKVLETSVEIVEVTDKGKTKDGVNAEFVVSKSPKRRAGKKRTETKN